MIEFFDQLMSFFDDVGGFWNRVIDIIQTISLALANTTTRIDATNFNDTIVANYLGYFRYIAGDTLYIAITSFALLGVGVTVWKTFLSGINYIKSLLPW